MDRTHVEGVTRRQFFNRSALSLLGLGMSGFVSASLAFLWPRKVASGGFGAGVAVGTVDEVRETLRATSEPVYVPAGRFFVVAYPDDAVPKAEDVYDGAVLEGMRSGFVALYQRCPHLGCRVPFCTTAQWFECGCHLSKYNRVGEKRGGPAPRGMDRFGLAVADGVVVVDTSTVIEGPPVGTNTTGQEAQGPHCVAPESGH